MFGDILRFFQRQNNWLGWLYFTLLYCVNVALFLPGIVLILGAGFIFGYCLHPSRLLHCAQLTNSLPELPHVALDLASRPIDLCPFIESALRQVLITVCRFWKGFLAVWLGGGVGQALAFLLARCAKQCSLEYLRCITGSPSQGI